LNNIEVEDSTHRK